MSGRKPKKNASRPDAADCYYVPYTADELAESRGQRKFAAYVNATFATLIGALEDHYDKTALILSSRIENCRPDKPPARPAADVESAIETAVIGANSDRKSRKNCRR